MAHLGIAVFALFSPCFTTPATACTALANRADLVAKIESEIRINSTKFAALAPRLRRPLSVSGPYQDAHWRATWSAAGPNFKVIRGLFNEERELTVGHWVSSTHLLSLSFPTQAELGLLYRENEPIEDGNFSTGYYIPNPGFQRSDPPPMSKEELEFALVRLIGRELGAYDSAAQPLLRAEELSAAQLSAIRASLEIMGIKRSDRLDIDQVRVESHGDGLGTLIEILSRSSLGQRAEIYLKLAQSIKHRPPTNQTARGINRIEDVLHPRQP